MNCIVIGHPFLTYNVTVTKEFLDKHNLLLGTYYVLGNDSRYIMEDAFKTYRETQNIKTGPGGEALVIARTIQWLTGQPKSVVFIGTRSMDDDSHRLMTLARSTGVSLQLQEVKQAITSVHLVLHFNKGRSEIFFSDWWSVPIKLSYMDTNCITKILERANLFFACDLTICFMPKALLRLAYYCCARFKQFCVSLSHYGLVCQHKQTIMETLAYTDVLFMDLECAQGLIKLYNIPISCLVCSSFEHQARAISKWIKSHSKKTCTVIVSDGLYVAYVHTDLHSGKTSKFRSKYLKADKVIDFYGVNYAFVAGFMAMMIQGCSLEVNIDCAFFTASLVSTMYGVDFASGEDKTLTEWKRRMELGELNVGNKGNKKLLSMPFTVFPSPWKPRTSEGRDESANVEDWF
ncbi:uncharacterized protein LOC101851748 isoform X2 [Aplysia californica]|nr:uncharacterized protein LOC101851748 isoform X2 [Aplysia californica]